MIHLGLLAAGGLLLLWLAAALLLDGAGRGVSPGSRFDAIVVLGCRVLDDGSVSGHLARRTREAVALWRQGKAPLVVFTGGGTPSEARAAATYAQDLGLPSEVTVIEDQSRTTAGNARLAAAHIEARRVLLVTDSYHVVRARRIFRRHFDVVGTAGVLAPWRPRLENALREVLALVWNALLRSGSRGRSDQSPPKT